MSSRPALLLPALVSLLALACLLPAGGGKVSADDSTIKVGVLTCLTKGVSYFGQSNLNGIKLAADEVNAAGGVGGRKIELVVEDDRSDSSEAAEIAQRFVERGEVRAVVGDIVSSHSLAAAVVFQHAGLPMVTSATNPLVTRAGDYVFSVAFNDSTQGEAMAKFAAVSLKAKRAAVIVDEDSPQYSESLAKEFERQFTKRGGQVVVRQSYAEGDKDFGRQLAAARRAGPDVLVVTGFYDDAGLIAKQVRAGGWNVPLLGGDGWNAARFYERAGPSLTGAYFTEQYAADAPSEENRKFVAAYRARHNESPNTLAALGYDAMKLLADALRRAPASDPKGLRDELARTRNFRGVTGLLDIDAERQAAKPLLVIEVKGGAFVYRETIWLDKHSRGAP